MVLGLAAATQAQPASAAKQALPATHPVPAARQAQQAQPAPAAKQAKPAAKQATQTQPAPEPQPAPAAQQLQPGTKVVIFGDSYSTFEGFIPEGYACWYPEYADRNDVHDVDSTWWRILCVERGWDVIFNSSYSGATICNHGYGGEDYADRSFVTRMVTDLVTPDGRPAACGQLPELLLVLAGTNDSWAGAEAGEVIPPEHMEGADLYKCLPATSYMFYYLKRRLPDTRIVMILNTDMRPEITDGLEAVCAMYGVECMRLHDIHKQMGHPSNAGMRAIAEQVGAFVK